MTEPKATKGALIVERKALFERVVEAEYQVGWMLRHGSPGVDDAELAKLRDVEAARRELYTVVRDYIDALPKGPRQ